MFFVNFIFNLWGFFGGGCCVALLVLCFCVLVALVLLRFLVGAVVPYYRGWCLSVFVVGLSV